MTFFFSLCLRSFELSKINKHEVVTLNTLNGHFVKLIKHDDFVNLFSYQSM
jgi:hypothetical protein